MACIARTTVAVSTPGQNPSSGVPPTRTAVHGLEKSTHTVDVACLRHSRFPSILRGSVGKFGLLHALRLTPLSFSLYLHVFGYSRSRRSPRERKCEKGLLLTDQSNRIELSFVAPPQGCQSTARHAQLVP